MDSSKLIIDNNDLVPIDYNSLLTKILAVMEIHKDNIFQLNSTGKRLKINVDKIAYEVAKSNLVPPLDVKKFGNRSATINFSLDFKDKFPILIRKIAEKLSLSLQQELEQKNLNLEQLLTNLLGDLQQLRGSSTGFGFKYNFNSVENLEKEGLIFDPKLSGSHSKLKLHKLTITVKDIGGLEQRLKDNLENYIRENFAFAEEEEIEELEDILKDEINDPNKNSSYYRLFRRVNSETLGKLKKEAKVRYLEYLLAQINPENERIFYLQDLVRRLRLLEEYLNDPTKTDDDYTVNYGGVTVNYQDLFARAEAYDSLPIFTIITGYLGEIRDYEAGEKQFVFGLKLKFNNKVNREEKTAHSFEYYLNLLDPDSKEHKKELQESEQNNKQTFQRKILRIVCLYFFVFASRINPKEKDYTPQSELNYNPREAWKKFKVIETLQSNDETKKKDLFKKIIEGFTKFNVKDKINNLANLLKDFLKQQAILPKVDYPLHIGVNKGILENDLDTILNTRQDLFKAVLGERSKECLQYFTIRDGYIDNSYLTHVSVNIKFEDLRYFSTGEKQTFSMSYDLQGLKVLPVVIAPWETDTKGKSRNFYFNNLGKDQANLILVEYDDLPLRTEIFKDLNSTQAYFYQVTFSLLIYLAFKIILDSGKKEQKIFIPMLRLHKYNGVTPYPEEKFMRALSKTLVHLFKENYLANSQGIKFQTINKFKIRNTLSSLYSVVPKTFTFTNNSYTPQLDKLALIVVSSRESDGNYRSNFKISSLFGEVIGFQLQGEKVRVETLNTFTGNYSHNDLFDSPEIIIEQVNRLYNQGFRHCIYLAKTPYSSTLNITATEEYDPESLYFLSLSIIKSLKGEHKDLKLYPIFYDKYYVRKLENLQKASYIQDPSQLTNTLSKNKQCVIFFNLFNGETVGDERFYNGVISYATMLNFYEGVLDDQDIRTGLLDPNNNYLKNDILQYLTFFHFSHYEKAGNNISLKLDPYEDILGDEGLGKTSIFPCLSQNINFNNLAFLTEVRRCLVDI